MARVKIEDVIDHLDFDIKRALEHAVRNSVPDAQINRNKLFRDFKRAVYRKCSTWERVPDRYVRLD
jgi:hypothetical protein